MGFVRSEEKAVCQIWGKSSLSDLRKKQMPEAVKSKAHFGLRVWPKAFCQKKAIKCFVIHLLTLLYLGTSFIFILFMGNADFIIRWLCYRKPSEYTSALKSVYFSNFKCFTVESCRGAYIQLQQKPGKRKWSDTVCFTIGSGSAIEGTSVNISMTQKRLLFVQGELLFKIIYDW